MKQELGLSIRSALMVGVSEWKSIPGLPWYLTVTDNPAAPFSWLLAISSLDGLVWCQGFGVFLLISWTSDMLVFLISITSFHLSVTLYALKFYIFWGNFSSAIYCLVSSSEHQIKSLFYLSLLLGLFTLPNVISNISKHKIDPLIIFFLAREDNIIYLMMQSRALEK